MKRKFLISSIALVLLSFQSVLLFSQTIPTPWTWRITSDYGPRMLPHWDFHEGIDYGGPEGTDIPAVEGGNITFIGGRNLYYIKIEGTHGEWTYMHIFSDGSLPRDSGNWELRNITLSNPVTNVSATSTVIILWSNRSQNIAEKVLCINQFNNREVRIGNNYVIGLDGSRIRSQGSVVDGEAIAPVGNSGIGTGTHLHLGLNEGEDNPLFHLQHDPSNYTITFRHPTDTDDGKKDGRITVSHDKPNTERINVRVNTTAGLDLNTLQFYIDQVDDNHRLWRFCYGGRDDDGGISNIQQSNGQTNGVASQSNSIDDFIYNWDSTSYLDGKHKIIAEATRT